MGSPKGIIKANWRSPEGWLLKGIITIYFRRGHRQTGRNRLGVASIGECLSKHVAYEDVSTIIGVEVTENAIENRGDKGTRLGYEREHPDKHLLGKKLWPYAVDIVQKQERLMLDDIRKIAKQATQTMKPWVRVKAGSIYLKSP